jgi:GT2 family glycosyltransferase
MSPLRERDRPGAAQRPDLALVLVHYHAPAAVAAAVAAMRRDLDASGLVAEWRIVDNGSNEQERRSLDDLGLPVLDGGGNFGFAAGVNRGIATATAPVLCVLNPDVEVLPGCMRALLRELEAGAGAAAPRLYWDRERRFLLPPGEERSRRWELLALGARRHPGRAAAARARWRRDARRHWEARTSLRSLRLSGAVLALSRAAWQRVGPFDEGYRLYFEETDWLLRLARAGFEPRQVAGAEAVHAFAHSTQHEPLAAEWFAESARRFRAEHYGRWFARLYDRIASAPVAVRSEASSLPRWTQGALAAALGAREGAGDVVSGPDRFWIELSPNREGFPAAGTRVAAGEVATWAPPSVLMRASALDGMSLCLVTQSGRELGRWWIDAEAEQAVAPAARS